MARALRRSSGRQGVEVPAVRSDSRGRSSMSQSPARPCASPVASFAAGVAAWERWRVLRRLGSVLHAWFWRTRFDGRVAAHGSRFPPFNPVREAELELRAPASLRRAHRHLPLRSARALRRVVAGDGGGARNAGGEEQPADFCVMRVRVALQARGSLVRGPTSCSGTLLPRLLAEIFNHDKIRAQQHVARI